MMKGKGGIHMVTFALLIIGGLNWLAVGILNWDISALVGGMGSPIAKIIYILVGLSAIYELAMHKESCKCCEGMGKSSMGTDTMAK
jgi:uncharacterized membrane protein YuzA (DUF378 family)